MALGPARSDPRPHPGAHRQPPRRVAQRPRLRDHRASAACRSATAATACSRCAISTASDRSCRALGPTALFDLPWMPIYLVICFLFHPYIGLAALFGAIILGIITMLTETMTREPTRAATNLCHGPHDARRDQPPQRRSAHGDGHDRPHRRALERCQHQVSGEPAARQRCRRRLRLDRPRCCA